MVELFKELWFLSASIIEVGVVYYFCFVYGKINNIKMIDAFLCGFIIWASAMIPIPFFKQILYIIIASMYLLIIRKVKFLKSIKFISLGLLYLLIFEVILCFILEEILKIVLTDLSLSTRLLYLIPIRIIQVLILYIIKRCSHGNVLVGSSRPN